MKKIEIREYEPHEQLVIVYELSNEDDVKHYDENPNWVKIDLFDPMIKYGSNCNIGYKGTGPETFARIIVESFKDYTSANSYIKARNKVEEYLAKLSNENSTVLKNFTILEKDVEHLL